MPLLAEGAAEEHGGDALKGGERKVNLWNGVMLPLQAPNEYEVRFWKTWKEEADAWTPGRPGRKTKHMKEWEAVLETFEMEAAEGSDSDPVVYRVLEEVKKRGDDLHQRLCELDRATQT